ncbi:Glycosyltransferase involved in cell wall bisynthesis [Roseivivax lentus]|uniref:Glycosyltransferase involved in cell wall bisynthesis n=1 Tax=Roseivivax lentus TaxID=633194 RepID=A0A1N7PAU0_9RHOB|nr:glycosyltransferase family 4 protein [Roseivivax lentus]SIT07691.1 Glycosyltransferase involved in cell wall bisynthesis [Roseivivax lentus]
MCPAHDAAFAVPGDLSSPTGGYHYDRSLLEALRAGGRDVTHVALPEGFPFPGPADMAEALCRLSEVPSERVVIVDGLAFGALETAALDRVAAPIIALVHHPLAHESGLPEAEARRLQALERENLTRAAHVLVPSAHIGEVLVSDYAVNSDRISVIRPGRPELPPDRPDAPPPGPPLILSVGLLHPRKGHDVLIAALAQIADMPWRAVIVGSPWEPGHDAALTRQIAEAGLVDRLRLAGRVGQAELNALYAQAHLFALATRYEGYGIVFDEALLRGLPIVSTTAGAVPGTVPEAAGTLVAPDDPAAFAEALRALLQDPQAHAAKSRAARLAAQDLPTWADAAARVGDILDRVAAGHRR